MMIHYNGKTYSGNNISVVNDKVYIDGVLQEGDVKNSKIVFEFKDCHIENLVVDKSVTCNGKISANNIKIGGSLSCDDIVGNVTAGGNISCDVIKGNVTAGGNISL